jgi:uncharacterized protein DUF3892
MAYRITCVTLSHGGWHHEHIVSVQWCDDANDVNYPATRRQVVAWIIAGHVFYSGYGLWAPQVEAYQVNGIWYIRSLPDHTTRDNLLSLDRCPVT